MTNNISDLRLLFAEPPMSARPLSLTESIDRLIRLLVSPPDEEDWIPMPDANHTGIRDVLVRMKELGFGGVVTNVGYENYLHNEESWDNFEQGVRICRELGLRVWIYDEVGYPSGAADGLVLQGHPELEAEALARSEYDVPAGKAEIRPPTGWRYAVKATCTCDGQSIEITDQIGSDGYLRWTTSSPCTIERYDVRAAFEGSHATKNYFAIRRCINVLNPDAAKRFYDVTYQAYIDRLGDDLDVVDAFFTDEPSFMSAYICEVPESLKPLIPVRDVPNERFDRLPQLAWRESLLQDFARRWNYDLLPRLGSLFGGSSPVDLRTRHDFHQLVSDLYAESYIGVLQSRLDEHGIELTGHMLTEEHIAQHVACEGSLIGNLKGLKKPGIDILSGLPEHLLNSMPLLTCKYGSSAAHMRGRRDVMCEASDWEQRGAGIKTTIEQRRGSLAVQMALGITTFASYFIWQGYDPKRIHELMDFCARIHTVMTSSVHVASVAVLYPIRTAWAEYVPGTEPINDSSAQKPLQWMDEALLKIAQTLLGGQIDFDFIDNQSLIGTTGQLKIAEESYDLLVIPSGAALCSDDMEAIRKLANGGNRILAFEPMSDIRLTESEGVSPHALFAELSVRHPDTVTVVDMADDWLHFVESGVRRSLRVSGDIRSLLVRQSRLHDGDMLLLVNSSPETIRLKVEISGERAELWNPCDGSSQPLPPEVVLEGYSARIVVLSD